MNDKKIPFTAAIAASLLGLAGGCDNAGNIETSPSQAEPHKMVSTLPETNQSPKIEVVKPAIEVTANDSSLPDERIMADRQLMSECIQLRNDNEILGQKINKLLHELYLARPQQQRDEMITQLLTDPLAQVRLTALELAMSRAKLGAKPDSAIVESTRLLLDDHNTEIRSSAAALLAILRDETSVQMIIDRLANEKLPTVRSAYIMSLGMLRDGRAADAIIAIMKSTDASDLTESLAAVVRLLDGNAVSENQTRQLSEIIPKLYNSKRTDAQRAGMLAVMRILAKPEFVKIMQSALSDDAASVRLEAINGLRKMNITAAAGDISELINDQDRGIRQAALETLGKLGATETLAAVLNRTSPEIETDVAVRERAWKTALDLLNGADNATISIIAESLHHRSDASEYHIRILEMLSGRLADKPDKRAEVDLDLAKLLIRVGRPAQAAEILAAAFSELDSSKLRNQIWLTWVKSLLAADDESVIGVISGNTDAKEFETAIEMIFAHIAELDENKNFDSLAELANRSANELSGRLTPDQIENFNIAANSAKQKQTAITIQQVKTLSEKLIAADNSDVENIQKQIIAMAPTGVEVLMDSLRQLLADNDNTTEAQKRIVSTITAAAPQLTGFDLNSNPQQKKEILDKWQSLLDQAESSQIDQNSQASPDDQIKNKNSN